MGEGKERHYASVRTYCSEEGEYPVDLCPHLPVYCPFSYTTPMQQQEVIVLGLSRSLPQPNVRNRMTGISQPGVVTSWSTTEGYYTTAGVSAGVSFGCFDIFTAPIEIDVEIEDKVEFTESTEFDSSKSCTSS